MRIVPRSQEGRAWRQRRRLLERRIRRRIGRLFQRPARDVQRHLLQLRQGGPGPLPPERREAGLLQRLLHQPAIFEQPLLTRPTTRRSPSNRAPFRFRGVNARPRRPRPRSVATWPRRRGQLSCQMFTPGTLSRREAPVPARCSPPGRYRRCESGEPRPAARHLVESCLAERVRPSSVPESGRVAGFRARTRVMIRAASLVTSLG
jgi:hypothetical protein